ncbi:hypothetical protein RFI_09660 [Reticulomyxa filosa]|uniref:EF-hand domain-containing protein n=1 Tax=Reticulomyxa filosa TaxID=46433 RepID=X6NMJ0_RETFI|nr:hypothetical protein RFI_09660 [Reticulomyxa filosa]|eukprot:ETO27470.1 hypothetical protein RFI_09660 [Reticulomyxa filosa]
MSKEGLEQALESLGIKLVDEQTKVKVFDYFNFKEDTVEEVGSKAGCIDFFDFCSCLNALADESDRESASVLFLCHDHDHDGLLTIEDVIRLLLAQNLILATINGGFKPTSIIRYSKPTILNHAYALLQHDTTHSNAVTQFFFFFFFFLQPVSTVPTYVYSFVSLFRLSFDNFMAVRGISKSYSE